jgi:outer membrane protein assembly factor BamB
VTEPTEGQSEPLGAASAPTRRLPRSWYVLALAVIASLAAAAVVVAITSGGAGRALPRAGGWSRDDLRPITQPAPIGGRLVLYVAGGGGMQIVGLDARSGATVWAHAASPSLVAPGQSPVLVTLSGLVIYLRQAGVPGAQLVGADPATGRVVWQSQVGYFTSWPYPCTADPAAICASGYLPSEVFGASYLRFDARDGAVLPSAAISASGTARMVGDGLFDPGARQPEEILAVKGASIAWSRTLASVFTFAGASTDWGWNFDRIPHTGLYVGSVGGRPLTLTRSRVVLNLARTMTAGFRVSDGSVVWRMNGAEYVCGELPCPGSNLSGRIDAADVFRDGATTGVAVRATGIATGMPQSAASAHVSRNATASLDGFDPKSGRTLWQFKAGHDVRLLTQLSLPPQTGLTTIVLRDSSGRLVTLDLATGSRKPTTAQAPAWCRSQTFYKERVPSSPRANLSATVYVGQPSLYPCTSAGARAAAPTRVPAFIGAIGARMDGLLAWSDRAGVVAIRP